jgi:transposase-like protein
LPDAVGFELGWGVSVTLPLGLSIMMPWRPLMGNPSEFHVLSTEIIGLALMMCIRFPLSLRDAEDLLHERGIDITHEIVRSWWKRLGSSFATQIRTKRVTAHT